MTPWIILISHILALLALDFFVLHKKNTTPSTKKAVLETLFFIANALLFAGVIYWIYSDGIRTNMPANEAVIDYLTGYFIELSLSVDNLFVIAMIFASFKIPIRHQHKLLFLGIMGALVFRALLISVGIVLINKIHGMNIIFGLFLLFTALKMLRKEEEQAETDEPKGLMKFFKFSKVLDGGKFVTTINGKKVLTALFGALISIELMDLLFALDSIPAIFAVTTDPFIVYSSNIFAIMGLRSLYFFLSTMLEKFHYIKYSVFAILLFVSIKLMAASWFKMPEWFSLVFIGGALGIGIWISVLKVKGEETT